MTVGLDAEATVLKDLNLDVPKGSIIFAETKLTPTITIKAC